MQNTFWTLIDDSYYRVHNGVLKYTTVCSETSSVLASNESKVETVTAKDLEKINSALGSKFTLDMF